MHAQTQIDLDLIEENLRIPFTVARQDEALEHKISRIVDTASETLRRTSLDPADVNAVYFTGGSTGLTFLTDRIAALFPNAKAVKGDRFSSVATGLGIYAARKFGKVR